MPKIGLVVLGLDKASRHLKRSIHLCLDHESRDLQSQNRNDECPPRTMIYAARLIHSCRTARRRTKNKKVRKIKTHVQPTLTYFPRY